MKIQLIVLSVFLFSNLLHAGEIKSDFSREYIKITVDEQNSELLVESCVDNNQSCILLHEQPITIEGLDKKISKEGLRGLADVGISVGGVAVGGFVGVVGGAGVSLGTAIAYIFGAGVVGGIGSYAFSDIWRSPIEHYKARRLLKNLKKSKVTYVDNMGATIDLLTRLLNN